MSEERDTCIAYEICSTFKNVTPYCYSKATSLAFKPVKVNELERLEVISAQLDEMRRCLQSLVVILNGK
jgi:hypothetical protein